ncbi:type II toxin-antitoxin system RelB/DinJ family antitoxin [Limosilactobacillus caccae]|jgi:DNA-damage-inducible protein J|uniref:type II toxin-antitoxin system RelB/DinJ family antitoxin n=1 Tax=Limosilactobacillus caccae TaxID=1926284 RepID=UPI00097021F1|nr:type II toxin-antitoxin system RelB/DinJ family antitoxin [Limosilactobacillus caccae]
MANETKVTARMDPALKKEAEMLLDDMGLNFSVWITMATKALVNEKKIPFEVKASPFFSEENTKVLEKRFKEYKNGSTISQHKLLDD